MSVLIREILWEDKISGQYCTQVNLSTLNPPLTSQRGARHKTPPETLVNSRSAINTDGLQTLFKTTINHH